MRKNHPERSLRIIGGSCRGRKVSFAADSGIRPTPNRVRETLFNWLAPLITGAHCLELFAGSGILSIEALSRGAHHVTLIDQSSRVTGHISRECERLGFRAAQYQMVTADALAWLSRADTAPDPAIDLVFLDPPFREGLLNRCLAELASRHWLAQEAWIYLESDTSLELLDWPPGWQLVRHKQAAAVHYGLCRTA